jgi:CRISPR-associated protein Csd1
MILQRLVQYYDRLWRASKVPIKGFQQKEIAFVIVLDDEGNFKGVDDTRVAEGRSRRSRVFEVPHEVKRSGSNAWKQSNLLWDNVQYALGYSAEDSETARKKHENFIKKIKEIFPDPQADAGIRAVLAFFERDCLSAIKGHPSWKDIEKAGANISFRLEKEDRLICQREEVVKRAQRLTGGNDGSRCTCLVTGDEDIPARLHTAIKGVRGAQSSGAYIVSFNLAAFNSFGKEQGLNAPVGENAEFAYTTALNFLLAKTSRQKMLVGDSTAVFWAQEEHPIEGWFARLFSEDWEGSDQENQVIKALYEAPVTGRLPILEDLTPFYILALSPNASRLSVRFWSEATVGQTVRSILQHFEDCRIVHSPKQPERFSLIGLLLSITPNQKAENIQPNLAGDMMFSILTGRPYPRTLLTSAIRRCRAEQNVTYERASLIKAVLARETRFYQRNIKEVDMALDRANPSVGYRLGRLFAVLEKIQEEASPGINATIRDRYYGAASSTPVTVFGTLIKLKNHHLAKLENKGRVVSLEKMIGEIMEGIEFFPSHLSLDEQGRFAIGYYHQRADFFLPKAKTEKEV